MTIEEVRALIPPGWVECDDRGYMVASDRGQPREIRHYSATEYICAIPAPKPEPRRVPMGEMVLEFHHLGYSAMVGFHEAFETVRVSCGGWESVANTKWRLDPDAREWVEVRDEA